MRHIRIIAAASCLCFALATLLSGQPAAAIDVPPQPATPVVDQTDTLTSEQSSALAQKIMTEQKATNNQIGVLMVATLDDTPIENYSLDVARGWGIGGTERDSGVLLLIAKDDRRLRIEVGYGLEGALPDIRANQIIRDRITPQFKAGKYYEGIDAGLDGIIAAIHGERDPVLQQTAAATPHIPWELIFFGIFIIPSWLASMLARTKSWWAGGVIGGGIGTVLGFLFGFLFIGIASIVGLTLLGLLLDRVVSANYQRRTGAGNAPSWWAGGPFIGGGRNDDGGWGGFGGGGFGGGGASGDW